MTSVPKLFVGSLNTAKDTLERIIDEAIASGAIEVSIRPCVLVSFTMPNAGSLLMDKEEELRSSGLSEDEVDGMLGRATVEEDENTNEVERISSIGSKFLLEAISEMAQVAPTENPRHYSGNYEINKDGVDYSITVETTGGDTDYKQALDRFITIKIKPALTE